MPWEVPRAGLKSWCPLSPLDWRSWRCLLFRPSLRSCLAVQFFVVTLYVPNSGQKLERLSYRTTEWDPDLRLYVESLETEGKPVVVTGDLNVAHL